MVYSKPIPSINAGSALKTDALYYQIFQFDPQALFQLMQLPVEGEYTYESITVKTTEKRMDGFFKRIDGEGPNVFLEVQGYPDSKIYWRFLREICTYHEQSEEAPPFVAIVLFVDKKYDPGPCPHFLQPSPSLDHCQSGGLPQRDRRAARGVDCVEAFDASQPGKAY